jgi:glycerol-3-phosphate dehydrogenase
MDSFDLLVIGGGINGCAIARAAALRGVRVLLVEKDDLASHTSSASSKLIHGGLRYLEYYEFRLVREALKEREVLLATAPHVVRPMRFVLPHSAGMRPWWIVRTGLRLYDLLARGSSLPRSKRALRKDVQLRAPLKPEAARRLALYWDAWVDDSRLVVLNALDASENGAEIATRTRFVSARREGGVWRATLSNGREVAAAGIANAAGPWVADVLGTGLREDSSSKVRLVKGSHIVVPRLFEGDQAYILQQPDKRVVFAIPYEGGFTLVGTTDIAVGAPEDARVEAREIDYLCAAANLYFQRQIAPADVVWSYSGVRSLYDDGAQSAQAVTRDYHLELDGDPGPKLLSVFGGKITTARALADEALDKLGIEKGSSTAFSPLPGGDIFDAFNIYLGQLAEWMPGPLLIRLSRAYGTRLPNLLAGASSVEDLGRDLGAGLHEAEVRYLQAHEFARTADDILWRRTKLGLHMSESERQAVAAFVGS